MNLPHLLSACDAVIAAEAAVMESDPLAPDAVGILLAHALETADDAFTAACPAAVVREVVLLAMGGTGAQQ